MARKGKVATLGQVEEALRAHSFEVSRISGGLRVSKYGCAAELEPVGTDTVDRAGSAMGYRASPGAVVGGEITRLLDRGYQKFVKTEKYEFPATAEQLDSIHRFSEELTTVTGGVTLYNESLGTTSDLYEYDRVKGRETAHPTGVRPWEQTAGH
jgi:hypothetical protein